MTALAAHAIVLALDFCQEHLARIAELDLYHDIVSFSLHSTEDVFAPLSLKHP